MEECKPFSLSLSPNRRVVDSPKLTDSISQSESLPGSVECLSPASSGVFVKVEPVIDSTDYTGVEPNARLNRSDYTEERKEWKTAYRMTKEEEDRISNMKEEEEEEEGEERQSVKMERDDGVKYGEGLWREQEKVREEQQRNGVTDQTCQTRRCQRNGGKSEYGQQEGAELSTLATACLLKQPRVLICRLKITGNSVSVSPSPSHPMASKEDWGVKVEHTQHEFSTLKGSCSLRQKGRVMTWKRKMIGQLETTQKQLPASSENGICVEASRNSLVISPWKQNTAIVPFMEKCKPFSLSLPPIRRVVDSTKLTDSISQSEYLPGSVECLSSASSGGYVKVEDVTDHADYRVEPKARLNRSAGPLNGGSDGYVKVEPVIDSTVYTGVEPNARLNRSDNTEEGTEWKTAYGMTKEEEDRLSNMKEEEEGGERQSVKMERDDGVKYGTSGAAAADGGEGPLCKEEEELHMQPCPAGDPEKRLQAELKQELEGEPLTPGHPLPGSAEGLEVHCALSNATRSGKVRELLRHHGGGSEHGGVLSNDRFSPRHFRASRRLRSEKNEGPTSHLERQQNGHPCGPPDGISTEMAFPLGSRGESAGSTPCKESFDTSAEAQSHQRIEGREEFVCSCCGKTGDGGDTLELQMHEEQHDTGRRFGCLDCGKRVPYKGNVHTGEKPFVCAQCGKSFSQISGLKAYQSVHTGEKTHSCDECGESFAHRRNLKSHQRVHKGKKPHSCNECGKRFACLKNLKIHQRVHTGEKPYICNECGKSFAYHHVLKDHQRVHTGEKPHSCDECGKSFAHLHNFKTHQRVHTGEKPYICNECGKSFADPRSLKSHQRVHTGEKPYICNECGKSFAYHHVLRVHQRVHTGEKPYSCDECGKSFAHLHGLKSHQRVHTGEKPHK